ncbi:MAG TPA: DUF3996 domain-containing protein [Bdellovibrionota bacterium]|nr:DUF3996 domain-containing protein [Bdellovibrionota bacterium]
MKRLLLAILVLGFSHSSLAATKSTGVGIILGEPTGFSFKHWTASDRAIDAGLSFSFSDFFLIHADYLFHFPGAFGTNEPFIRQLDPYVGIGAALFFSTKSGRTDRKFFTDDGSSVGFGIRIPLGIEWLIPRAPFGIFLELVPGIGVRYYF